MYHFEAPKLERKVDEGVGMGKTLFLIDFAVSAMRGVSSASFNRLYDEKLVLSVGSLDDVVRGGVGEEVMKEIELNPKSDLIVCCRRWQMLCALVWALRRC